MDASMSSTRILAESRMDIQNTLEFVQSRDAESIIPQSSPPLESMISSRISVATPPPTNDVRMTSTVSAITKENDDSLKGSSSTTALFQFVKARGGNRVIQRILIANNGMAAVKCIISLRQWAYETFGDRHMIRLAVMATPNDIDAGSEYVRLADELVQVPGGSNNNNYANVDLIVDVAQRLGVDAVWAGWGHASENPRLPESLQRTSRNIAFLGPSAVPMELLGDKIASTIIAQSAGVRTMSWSGDGLRVDLESFRQKQSNSSKKSTQATSVPKDIYDQACISSAEQCRLVSARIGYPVMIKASEGGGGKGIRKAFNDDDAMIGYRQVSTEVPGSPIFIMKLAPKSSRHLEVQVLGDLYGNSISIYGRDCSVQRRHQKIFEEGPVYVAPPDLWNEMAQSAVALTKRVGYSGAGTVEYLYFEGEYCFLELNPRLQVEHPVTELISGVNIPACQLLIAMGIPLSHIPHIRSLYNHDPQGLTDIDFSLAKQRPPNGHVIAARITAENPLDGFKPSSGSLQELLFRGVPNVWGYFSVSPSGAVHEFADSQIAHFFAHGTTREEARRNLVAVLKELVIRGDIWTTHEYLPKLLETDEFKQGTFDTNWLDSLIAAKDMPDPPEKFVAVLCGALYKAWSKIGQMQKDFLSALERGQMPPQYLLKKNKIDVELVYLGFKYSFVVYQSGPEFFTLSLNNTYVDGEIRLLRDGGFLITLDGRTHVMYAQDSALGLRLSINGQSCVIAKDFDPSQLITSMPGKLVRFMVEDGTHISAGQSFAEIEVMKMNMPLITTESGVIHFCKTEGSVLSPGDKVAMLELDDKSRIRVALPFSGHLPNMKSSHHIDERVHHNLKHAREGLEAYMWGYAKHPSILQSDIRSLLDRLMFAMEDSQVPFLEFHECVAVIGSRLPVSIRDGITKLVNNVKAQKCENFLEVMNSPSNVTGVSKRIEFPSAALLDIIRNASDSMSKSSSIRDSETLNTLCQPLVEICERFSNGTTGNLVQCIHSFFHMYLDVEKLYDGVSDLEAVILGLREKYKGDKTRDASGNIGLRRVLGIALSHEALTIKNVVVNSLLNIVEERDLVNHFSRELRDFAALSSKAYSSVSLRARQLLLVEKAPSYLQRREAMLEYLRMSVSSDTTERLARLESLTDYRQSINEVLVSFFGDRNASISAAALETYIKREYGLYDIVAITVIHEPTIESHTMESGNTPSSLISYQRPSGFSPMKKGISPPFFPDNNHLSQSYPSNTVALWQFFDASAVSSFPIIRLHGTSYDRQSSFNGASARSGILLMYRSLESLETSFSGRLIRHLTDYVDPDVYNVVYVMIHHSSTDTLHSTEESAFDEGLFLTSFTQLLQRHVSTLNSFGVSRVTAVLVRDGSLPVYYTFRQNLDFTEDTIYRYVNPPQAFQLELARLLNFQIELALSDYPHLHLYYGREIHQSDRDSAVGAGSDCRLFVRATVRTVDAIITSTGFDFPEAEKTFSEALKVLELVIYEDRFSTAVWNQIFINVIPDVSTDPDNFESFVKWLVDRYADRLNKVMVNLVEWKVTLLETTNIKKINGSPLMSGDDSINHNNGEFRFVALNSSGLHFEVSRYYEVKNEVVLKTSSDVCSGSPIPVKDSASFHRTSVKSYSHIPTVEHVTTLISDPVDRRGVWHNLPALSPYPILDSLTRKRILARRMETTYVYDFLELFQVCLLESWSKNNINENVIVNSQIMTTSELVLSADKQNLEILPLSVPGRNKCGMVAWRITMKTPEYPDGRDIILIANDITFVQGSFGPDEDMLFCLASKLARKDGIPRIYLAANSGARIGIADEVRALFKIQWVDSDDPTKGFQYLYLETNDLKTLGNSVILTTPVYDTNNIVLHHRITDIIGRKHGIGVENLQGSGMIAGETSRAYHDTFTLTYVTVRTVGIGAYLLRLGQRAIQTESPIILTGYQALNSVLGKDLYVSNLQLGGPKIMMSNGVSHLCVGSDLEGVASMIKWLSYVPRVKGEGFPMIYRNCSDPVDRDIEYEVPGEGPYDPRCLLIGVRNTDESYSDSASFDFRRGFFDKDSFTETLSWWANTVIVGRARLGGIPMGVIAVETRTIDKIIPADPAAPVSEQRIIQQAGQVWYPDSAYKTAQAIADFNAEGIPLIIFANWRGFSGGTRDMFDEVLKFGSFIVDNLIEYQQPCFIYIPPRGELRGGAWVVVDPTINSDVMEMYADPTSRGGVLEPAGIVEIKYRERDLFSTMMRLDVKLGSLGKEANDDSLSDDSRKDIQKKIKERADLIRPLYQQVAIQFADLHDTPGRMKAKRVITEIIPWKSARRFFYYRLRRRLVVFEFARTLMKYDSSLTFSVAQRIINEKSRSECNNGIPFSSAQNYEDLMREDILLTEWFESVSGSTMLQSVINNIKQDLVVRNFKNWINSEEDNIEKNIINVTEAMGKWMSELNSDALEMFGKLISEHIEKNRMK